MARAKAKAAPKPAVQAEPEVAAEPAPVDDGTITWERPSGTTLTTASDDATVAHCESLGWKRV